MIPDPQRGHVYRMSDPEYGTLHCLVISIASSYQGDESVLAVRVTVTGQIHRFPGWVRMTSGDPCAGYVVVGDLDRVDCEEFSQDLGPLSATTLFETEQALKKMLGL